MAAKESRSIFLGFPTMDPAGIDHEREAPLFPSAGEVVGGYSYLFDNFTPPYTGLKVFLGSKGLCALF